MVSDLHMHSTASDGELTPEQVLSTKWIEKTTTNPPSEGQR